MSLLNSGVSEMCSFLGEVVALTKGFFLPPPLHPARLIAMSLGLHLFPGGFAFIFNHTSQLDNHNRQGVTRFGVKLLGLV